MKTEYVKKEDAMKIIEAAVDMTNGLLEAILRLLATMDRLEIEEVEK